MPRKLTFYTGLGLLALLASTGCHTTSPEEAYDKLDAARIFTQGQQHLKTQRYGLAIEDFDALEARYPYSGYTEKSQLAMIYAHYQTDEPAAALAAAERFIQIHPRHPDVDYAYYMKGLIKFSESATSFDHYLPLNRATRDITATREAFFHFDELLRRFPKSSYAPDAHQRMVFLKNCLGEHELLVAQHYFERKAYVAAVNRALVVIEQFGDTPSQKAALTLMAEAYQALGLQPLAEEAQKVARGAHP